MADRHSDWTGLVEKVLAAGKAVLPFVVPGATPMIEAADKIIELIDHTKQMVDGDVDVAELDRTRDAFEAAVNHRVDDTIDNLRGGG